MQLICNELSFYPLAENVHIAELRFKLFLKTFNETQKKYGFNHIRFPQNLANLQVTTTHTFYVFVSELTNRTLKNLILDLCKAPYTDDLTEPELITFYESNYEIQGEDKPIIEQPIGLPVSFIKSLPSISFNTHSFWQKRKIFIKKINEEEQESTEFLVYNICLETDINTDELTEWANSSMPELINSEDILKKYLSYTNYEIVFTDNFMTQFYECKQADFEQFKRLLLLMKDVQLHPFTGGIGKTENLKDREKEASKRITSSDRLSYELEKNTVTFIACKGHYNFH